MTNEIYKLSTITDDPRYEGFAFADARSLPSQLGRPSFDDDLTPGFNEDQSGWKQPRLAGGWVPPKVVGRVPEYNDYPCVDMTMPAFSERAVEVLRPMLESNGELLPLDAATKTRFYFYNVLTISDALDRGRSKCTFFRSRPMRAVDIDHFQFEKSRLRGLTIFRIYEMPMLLLVTNEFVQRVESAGLRGFDFTKVWPLDPSINWRMQGNKKARDADRARLKRQTVILVLPLEGVGQGEERVARFEDLLDSRLRVEGPESRYLGSYEGRDVVDGDCRMFLSCPDAEALLEFLKGDLRGLAWPSPIQVFLRNGGMYDEKAPERALEI